ncbi:hypothetical protein K0U07_04885 [bacterium]|nr:hypothetical protein [bacterium]
MTENSLEMTTALSLLRKKIEEERDLHPKDYLEKDVELLYSIAHKHYTIDQYDKAEPLFVRLVLARPEQIAYWKGLASCRQMQKDFSGALIAWGMCATLDPDDLSFHIYGAECLYFLNEMEEAASAIAFVESKIDDNHPYFPKFIKIKRSLMGEEDGI